MSAQQPTNNFKIEIDGLALAATINVVRVVVEDHLHLPDAFAVTIRDAARTALAASKVKIGSAIKISVISSGASAPERLLAGEVTAIEGELYGKSNFSIIRGYDQSHRLFRGRTTESYRDMTYSDVVRKVTKRIGLKAGTIDSSSPTHPHISQANENDWTFLGRLAREVGFELSVNDSLLHFRKPASSQTAPSSSGVKPEDPLVLTPGVNLLQLRASVSAAEQVKEVEVRGWDPSAKKVVVSRVKTATESIHNGADQAKIAGTFAGPNLVSSGTPYSTILEVEQAAKALADQVASAFTEIEGEARGSVKLRSGAAVQVALMGEPFDGKYVLTTTRHSYEPEEGYVTGFVISGRHERSLHRLAGGSDSSASNRIEGVGSALVDDVNDPLNLCRVRLEFPWMADGYVSDWARVVQAGAGKNRGAVIMPEVGDEVLVAFEQGDFRRPLVLGGLYNGVDIPKFGPGSLLDSSSKAVDQRVFTSRTGHQMVFVDADDGQGVLIHTGDGSMSIRLDQSKSKMAIDATGDLEITVGGNVKLSAKGSLELSGQSVKITSDSSWSAKGSQVTLEGSGPVQVKGQPIQLN